MIQALKWLCAKCGAVHWYLPALGCRKCGHKKLTEAR